MRQIDELVVQRALLGKHALDQDAISGQMRVGRVLPIITAIRSSVCATSIDLMPLSGQS